VTAGRTGRVTPDRWERIQEIFHAARVRTAGERGAFLDQACADDPTLRREVQNLLDHSVPTRDFVDLVGGPVTGAAESMPVLGPRFGAYLIQDLIGRGGMGEVYRAHDTKLGRDVAIKVLPRAFATDPDRLARFEREARAVAATAGGSLGQALQMSADELVESRELAQRVLAQAAAQHDPARRVETAQQLITKPPSGVTERDQLATHLRAMAVLLRDVEVLASHDGVPVLLRQGRFLIASFHPELTGDTRVHEKFLELVREEMHVGA